MRNWREPSRPNWQTNQIVLIAAVVIVILTLGVIANRTQAQSARNLPEARYTGGGPEACLTCHGGPHMTLMADTPHGDARDPHTPYGQESCESCHGPGSFHVSSARGGIGFPPLNDFRYVGRPLQGQFSSCLGCHEKTNGARVGIGWVGRAHDNSGMSCSSCHEVHTTENLLADVTQQQNLCASCHGFGNTKHAGFEKNGIRLEILKCSTCHNPHDQ
ncbi:cytochrome c nitrite reductase pentaheme subunit [Ruegeria denitrificans]|uniref:Cytochrome c nitrite reductase pentaheme subunit n=1 Tax=Ruegeria denitrificans TaxID=1715692 RepID=A0A0P1I0H9_9RHOB|nr:cytochrome c3 family protein [Ruegeria denitrificans]CUJ83187.1 cytochrome c nitrite reductase pentaheme subunit [Ruegeria denitrificans]